MHWYVVSWSQRPVDFMFCSASALMCCSNHMCKWAFGYWKWIWRCFISFVIQLENAELFNSYLQSLKSSIPNRGLDVFWDLLVQGMISFFNWSCRVSLKPFLSFKDFRCSCTVHFLGASKQHNKTAEEDCLSKFPRVPTPKCANVSLIFVWQTPLLWSARTRSKAVPCPKAKQIRWECSYIL